VQTTTECRATASWLIVPRPNLRARLRLFCFPYAGGGAATYLAWPGLLPEDIEVCCLQLPGRGGRIREQPYTRLRPLAEAIAENLRPHLGKPFAFFGHSMGALVCFEVARLLRREGGPKPLHLFASACRAPQLSDDRPATHDLPEPQFLAVLRRYEGTPQEVLDNWEIMQLAIPVLRADFEVTQTYAYEDGPPLDCPLTALGGLQDQTVSREQIEAWGRQTTARFVSRMFPGGHFFLNTSGHVLLSIISRDLRRRLSAEGAA
jgi:medium-chain acyl-[acyl-carrier-protein] hydrolase